MNYPAMLLLGPTGTGKTPLGAMIEQRGHRGRRCLHFDFGANLRDVVARHASPDGHAPDADCPRKGDCLGEGPCPREPNIEFTRDEIEFLGNVLTSGALLEDEHFPIARRILESFMIRRAAGAEPWIILNGLPRHAGQARAIDGLLDVARVVQLRSTSETVLRRLRSNGGGDRTTRTDDDLESVEKKLAIFQERTLPLVDHYRRQGAVVQTIEVSPEMTTEQTWAALERGDDNQ